jgi:hypothetical protein
MAPMPHAWIVTLFFMRILQWDALFIPTMFSATCLVTCGPQTSKACWFLSGNCSGTTRISHTSKRPTATRSRSRKRRTLKLPGRLGSSLFAAQTTYSHD